MGSFFVKLTILPVLRIRYQGFQMTEMLITSIFIEKSRCCYSICFLFIPEYPVGNSSDFPYYYFAKFKLLRNTIHKSSICLHFSCTTDHFFDGSEIKITFLSRRNMCPKPPPSDTRPSAVFSSPYPNAHKSSSLYSHWNAPVFHSMISYQIPA